MDKNSSNQLSFFDKDFFQKDKVNSDKLHLFISYCHKDEKFIEEFEKHISKLKNIIYWRDREVRIGQNYKLKILEKLNSSNIICIFLSSDFLNSKSCKEELNRAKQLKKDKDCVHLCPIILSDCDWKSKTGLKENYLALPQDAKPIDSFSDSDRKKVWTQVCDQIKEITNKELQIMKIDISTEFKDFLNNAEILTQTHSQKTKLLLEDIFIDPNLSKHGDQEIESQNINSKEIVDELMQNKKILISGQDMSGKTTLCKHIFTKLRKKNLVPIFLSEETDYRGHFENIIIKKYKKQYKDIVSYEDIGKDKIVPIVDNFHLLKNKSKIINNLSEFKYQILTSDDKLTLYVVNEQYIKNHFKYKIKEFNNSLRDKLIKKWLSIGKPANNDENTFLKSIDQKTQQINEGLGKNVLYTGIMPSYPIFILSILSGHEMLEKPINNQITSQGYCYEILIYAYLFKQKVPSDEIDTYLNILTELSYIFFKRGENEINQNDLRSFLEKYEKKYYLTISHQKIFDILYRTKIISKNNFGNCYFNYPYIYYFFVARYMSNKLNEDGVKSEVKNIIGNLHNDNNAYITIFLVHHSSDPYILEEILDVSKSLFHRVIPATLSKQDMKFFDEQSEIVTKACLPEKPSNYEKERKEALEKVDEIEENNHIGDYKSETEISKQLRRSIRTVETMGQIVKNRSGSLEKKQVEMILSEAIDIHLRILSSFFDIIKNPDEQKVCISYLKEKIEAIIRKDDERFKEEKLHKIAKKLFWNLNFYTVQGFIHIIIHSLGSDKLNTIIGSICDKKGTPISKVIKYGVGMWYCKNLPIKSISETIKDMDFSKTAEEVTKYLVINHILLHPFNYKDLQKIKQAFNLSQKTMTLARSKNLKNKNLNRITSP